MRIHLIEGTGHHFPTDSAIESAREVDAVPRAGATKVSSSDHQRTTSHENDIE